MSNYLMTKDQVLKLLLAEYQYWYEADGDDVAQFSLGAMGALSNVIAAIHEGQWMPTQMRSVKEVTLDGAKFGRYFTLQDSNLTASSESASQSPSP